MACSAVEAALRIADELVSTAVPARFGGTWEGTVVVGADGDTPLTADGDVGSSLYDGTAGIALALTAASRAASWRPRARRHRGPGTLTRR